MVMVKSDLLDWRYYENRSGRVLYILLLTDENEDVVLQNSFVIENSILFRITNQLSEMSIINIQTKAAEYKFILSTTAKKKQEWATIGAPAVIDTLNQIIEVSELQNFAHIITADGNYGRIVYLNLLYIEKGTAEILDSSDKDNLKTGRQLAFKPLQNGDIGIYFCENENGEYEAEHIDTHEPQDLNDGVHVTKYFEEFLESVIS